MKIIDEVRSALRGFRRQPAFPAASIFILAVTIGANASVFSLIKSILLAPLAMKRPDELIVLDAMRPDGTRYPFTIPYFLELQNRVPLLTDVAAYGGVNVNLATESAPERVLGARVSGNFFPMLGIQPVAGRLLVPEDDEPGHPKVVVIADGLWRRRFGGEAGAIGRQVRLNGDSYTLVGVLPRSFQFKNQGQEFAIPLSAASDPFRGIWTSTAFLRVYGRLQSGATPIQAKASLNEAAAAIRREHPQELAMIVGLDVQSLQEHFTGDSRMLLTVLMAAVALVLLIACANISSLAVARSAGRMKELSIRLALGATRWSVARHILVENILLYALGGAAGLCLARWGLDLFLAAMPAQLPRLQEVRLDWLVAAAVLGCSLICGLLFGSIPAIQAQTGDVSVALRADGRGNTGTRGRRLLLSTLVIVEAALSLVLLAGTGLLLQSFFRIISVDPGFRAERLTTFRLALPSTRYKTAGDVTVLHDKLLLEFRTMPGVEQAASISILPFSGPSASSDFTIEGAAPVAAAEKPGAQYRMADNAYFKTMNIPLHTGRVFSETDTASTPPVVVISQSLARRYWKGRDPIGSTIRIEDTTRGPRTVEVIGVVGDTRESSLEEEPVPCLYVAMPQIPANLVRFLTNNMFWTVRTSGLIDVTASVRRAIANIDGDVAVASGSMREYLAGATAKRRFVVFLLSAFSMAALLLAAGGLYALISFSSAQRMREFGVRIALGARPRDVARSILWQGVSFALMGAAAGSLATVAASRYFASMLFRVSPADPIALGCAALILLTAAVGACVAPMRRAMRADPTDCLRAD